MNSNNNKLITVGITSHERLSTLKQAVNSVINQTYYNLEIFICDDSSSDVRIQDFLESLALTDKRVKFFKRDKKHGVTENLNLMVRSASGEYFLWLCDDDWIDHDYIETCLEFVEKNNDYSLVTGISKFYIENKFLYLADEISVEEENPKERFLSFHNQSLGSANSPNFGLIKVEHLLKTPLKNILGHDNVLVGNLSIYGKIKTLHSVSVHRRLGGMSETLSKMSKVCDYSLLEKYLSFFALYLNITSDILTYKSEHKNFSFSERLELVILFTYNLIKNLNTNISRYLNLRSSSVQDSNDIDVISVKQVEFVHVE